MKLRIRDTKTSLLHSEHVIKTSGNCTAKAFSSKHKKSKDCSLSDYSNSTTNSPSAGVCYASSFTRSCDVTFVTIQELRSTTSLNKEAINCEFDNRLQPLDLSTKFSNREDEINTSDVALNLSGDLAASTRNYSEEERDSDSVSEVDKILLESDFLKKNSYEMLSSRRHRSDETFADREHLNSDSRQSSYPRSAEGWLDARSYPDGEDSGNLEMADETKDSNSNTSYQSMRDEEEEEAESQDVAFNYSTKNQTAKKIDSENLDSKLLKAKRARVENIVTNIKDKPQKQTTSEANLDASNCDSEISSNEQSRKRRMGEKIRELQLEIESLQKECENEVYDQSKENYDVDDNGAATNKDWNMNHKRARYDDTEDRKETAKTGDNGFYRGSVNFMFPQNGNRANSDLVAQTMAFQMLFRSIKRELVTVVEKVAERSAKRILEELNTSGKIENNQTFRKSDATSEEQGRLKKQDDLDLMELVGSKKSYHTSRFVINDNHNFLNPPLYSGPSANQRSKSWLGTEKDKTENVHTSNQSQLCFGDLQVRKTQLVNDGRNSQLAKPFSRREQDDWENTSRISDSPSQSPDNIRSENSEQEFQTQALSLVKKKSSSPLSVKSSTPLVKRPFVIRDGKERTISLPTSPTQDVENLVKDMSKSSHLSDSGSNPARTSPDTPTQSKVLHPPFLPDANFYSSAAGAFRLPFRNDALSSPPFRRDSYSATNLMKASPFFPPSIYPSTAAPSPSVFPFSTGQLPFPLFQNFQQRSLASAIADYGRFNREGFEHGTSRPVSTRTSTREPPRTSGLSRSHHGHKPDPLDFRNASAEVSPYSAASIQEGLTPQHLKKAKLMFFYTRYPSANTLKTYFADVKFSRATTSQLIKWFSNFREFYYIQMEKFARQALSDGVTDISKLKVTRDCELFRVLNLHYNKSNDFRLQEIA